MSPAPLTPILGGAAIGVGYAGSSYNLQASTPVPFAASAGKLQQKFARRLRPAVVRQAIRQFFRSAARGRRQRAAKFAAANRCLLVKIDAANPASLMDQRAMFLFCTLNARRCQGLLRGIRPCP